ncbi:cytochrome ubiquinol oxidase subunit I [Sulfobacillus harzensis]|uniref:Cytochrome ubiquinol oxidase subunit I n=1 Tax=Sulfobacillus harzensis TaxID=2729629 RepID=A0A7Y0L113_9FIRM|nr:cytochrome ubiquinol oxidase subunit I [Sulfobacillus harzensis]NMP21265.1 cytochrome ubiquinol oxidase subunit I [Sulfobacillus harzensis]
MTAEGLARLQFGTMTIYHFIFVPITIGLSFMLAILETRYWRTRKPEDKKVLDFFGRLFLINFAVGVVTGILQEFQFGMNWSNYSRFVGDVFGAPLAVEALAAFFLESTFIGIWIFGWDRLSPRVHTLSMWLVAIGTSLSAFWILTANSFMQEPVGYKIVNGHAEMTNFFALLGNPQLWVEFPHVEAGALTTGAFFVAGISAYFLLVKKQYRDWFMAPFRIAMIVAAAGSVVAIAIGHDQAQHLIMAQPMKMAASEALWHTSKLHASWSIISLFNPVTHHTWFKISIPSMLSILAYNRLTGRIPGIAELQSLYVHRYGPGNYVPPVLATYWSFRLMILFAFLMAIIAIWGLVLIYRKRLLDRPRFLRLMPWAIGLPLLANIMGWVMTEVGRQPWIVFGLQKTINGVSPTVSTTDVAITLIGFTILYAIMGVMEVRLLLRFIRLGPDAPESEHSSAVENHEPKLFEF